MLRNSKLLISGRREGLSNVVISYLEENLDGGYETKKGDMIDPYTFMTMAEDEGIAIMPESVDIRGFNLVRVPIRPVLSLDLVLVWNANPRQTKLQKEVVDFVLSYAKS